MKDPYLLHVFSPTKYVSPFDINMAYEAKYDAVIPYCNVTLDEIHPLTQDTIFSRSPVGVKRTGIFMGGIFPSTFDAVSGSDSDEPSGILPEALAPGNTRALTCCQALFKDALAAAFLNFPQSKASA